MNKLTPGSGIVLCLVLLFMACKKELSVENGLAGGTAQGELVDSLGNCKRADIRGTYAVDTALNTSTNYALINVNFTSQGKYKIYTDTVNGMWFIDSGFTVTTGAVTIKLKGYGTPILPKISDFALIFNNTLCAFSVNVGGTASGGSGNATPTGSNGDYFPTTSGSKWAYQYLPSRNATTLPTDTFSVNVPAGLVTLDTLSYARFGTNYQDTFYFAKLNGNYYARSTVEFDYVYLFDTIPAYFITYPFLKESAAVGTTWSTEEYGPVWTGGVRGMAIAKFTIDGKDVAHVVGSTTYTTIAVKREITFKPDGGTYSAFFSGKSYYAKGVGLVDQVFDTNPAQKLALYNTPTIR